MMITINPARCIGCRLCVGICPAVFSMDGRVACAINGALPPAFAHRTVQAAEACPTQAIALEGEA